MRRLAGRRFLAAAALSGFRTRSGPRGALRLKAGGRLKVRPTALLAAFLVVLAGCMRPRHDPTAVVPEQDLPELSIVNVNDPAAEPQLVRGFYTLESNQWRWTQKNFEVLLKPPQGGAEKGARLSMKLNVPQVIVSKFGPVTLKATINGLALAPETYSKPDNYVYSRDVPPAALKSDTVVVDFNADKGIEPTPTDARQLSLVAVSIGLESK